MKFPAIGFGTNFCTIREPASIRASDPNVLHAFPLLGALSDKQMSAAITSMHDEPAHDWTVEELGQRAGMSRSIFALKFKQKVGVSPMEYLTRWRMLLAGDRIANTSDSISEIAQSLGYESASAFAKAFKKIMGCSPRQYSRGQSSTSPALS